MGGYLQPGLSGPQGGHLAEASATTVQPHPDTGRATQTVTTIAKANPTKTGSSQNDEWAQPCEGTRPSGAPPTPKVKVKTEAQLARNPKKFQKLKEKRKARELVACHQHRLAWQLVPISDPEAASQPPSEPTPPVAMEVDQPATNTREHNA